VKELATREIFDRVFPGQDFDFQAIKVDSGVTHTPVTNEEMIRGALNRCKRAFQSFNSENDQVDYSVGIEGGLDTVDGVGTFLKAWSVVLSKTGRIGYGYTPGILIPERFVVKLDDNTELADIAAEISQVEDIRSKEGVFGYLTNHRITRRIAFHAALTNALAPFYNPDAYK
jgi:inosine/xanthosine triphosphatase